MEITVTITDDLAAELQPLQDQLPQILQLGMQRWRAREQGTYDDFADLMEKLAQLPEPQEILGLRPTEELQSRIRELLDKNRGPGLSAEEEAEWRRYEAMEHLIRIAKAKAAAKMKAESEASR